MKMPKQIRDTICAHANAEAPIEACGYLAGKNGVVTHLYKMTNMDAREDHFSLDAGEQFEAMKAARRENLQIMAVYHSHPSTPARPSKEDIRLAFDPDIRYVIASLAGNRFSIKSFLIKDGKVRSEPLKII